MALIPTFSNFYLCFKKSFDLKKQCSRNNYYYYTYSCQYKNGNFNLNYKINEKRYYMKIHLTDLLNSPERKKMFLKFFKLNKEMKEIDIKFFGGPKDAISYYEFQFHIFRTVLAVYLYEKITNGEEDVMNLDMNLLKLYENQRFIELINKVDANKKNFYGLFL